MDDTGKISPKKLSIAASAVALFMLLISIYLGIRVSTLKTETQNQTEEIKSLTERISLYEADIAEREEEKNELENELLEKSDEVDQLNRDFGRVVKTVNTLEKLSQTDKELLQKYSKISFLNEHYVPSNLSNISEKYLQNPKQELQVHSKVNYFLKDLLEEAEDDKIEINIISAYRSFSTQNTLKSSYTVQYGSGANAFSADQGFSEHQLGTTFDFTTPTLGTAFSSFENTEAYKWLQDNAYKYGFVLSYPKNNQYYIFEPWHWRFIGVKLATKLHRDGDSFYNVDQRDIDKYLINIFDR